MPLAAPGRGTPDDTVAALSSAPGASARAVVRLTGPRAWALAGEVFAPAPGRAGARPPGAVRAGARVDGALRLPGWPPAPAVAVWLRGPRSYTGQDLVELWVPGAPPLVRRLLLALEAAGARPAAPGEFTRRAFLAGRLDLTQAEAVLALTTAEDAAGARAALRALAGGAREGVDAAKAALTDVLAHVEAAIDFSEEDIDHLPGAALAARLDRAGAALRALLGAGEARPQARTEPVVALVGPANAGKSSLMNALSGLPAALVSPHAGTTRDVLAAAWRLPSGRVVRLLDTAGEKPAVGEVEARALDLARAAAASADVVVQVVDGLDPRLPAGPGALVVVTKADVAPAAVGRPRTSVVTGEGLLALGEAVDAALSARGAAPDLTGTARQEAHLDRALEAVGRAADLLRGQDPARAELAAVELEAALEALGELTGAVTTDDVLDRVFGQFCVGK
ncbi:MAG: 50S ribosome-binding GTPase [Planctomycetes bacterium]|nr:50S ribosome-binding GTPase [Planctomycetota bacterium]